MKKQFLKTSLIAMAGIGLFAGSAMALPMISGSLNMTGSSSILDDSDAVVTNYLEGTKVDFNHNGFGVAGTVKISNGLGTFASLPGTDDEVDHLDGIIYDLDFNQLGTLTPALSPLWSFTGMASDPENTFSFIMESIALDAPTSATSLTLKGTGYIMASSTYAETPGTWYFSAQGGLANVTWSATQVASPVPEPATMLLFGSGMLGLAFIGRRIRE